MRTTSSTGATGGGSSSDTTDMSSMCDGGNTSGELTSKPNASTSVLGEQALRIDVFERHLEEELKCHIADGSGSSGG